MCVCISNSLWRTSAPSILKYKIYLMDFLLAPSDEVGTREHV